MNIQVICTFLVGGMAQSLFLFKSLWHQTVVGVSELICAEVASESSVFKKMCGWLSSLSSEEAPVSLYHL